MTAKQMAKWVKATPEERMEMMEAEEEELNRLLKPRRNPDEDFRTLERQAKEGDEIAIERFIHHARRIGKLDLIPPAMFRTWKLRYNVRELQEGRLPIPDCEKIQTKESYLQEIVEDPSFYPEGERFRRHWRVWVFPNRLGVLVRQISETSYNILPSRIAKGQTYQQHTFARGANFVGTLRTESAEVNFNRPAVPTGGWSLPQLWLKNVAISEDNALLIQILKRISEFVIRKGSAANERLVFWKDQQICTYLEDPDRWS